MIVEPVHLRQAAEIKRLKREILEIIGHLGAAISQSSPSDDQIIMDHVREAKDIADKAWSRHEQ